MGAPSESGSVSGIGRKRSTPLSDDTLTVELTHGVRVEASASAHPSSIEPEPGTVLASRYLLEEMIGRGGTSNVYRARDLRPAVSLDAAVHFVALKLPRSTPGAEPLALARLQREFHTMRGLSHAGIARAFELACDGDDLCFMSMQLIEGRTLEAWMTAGGTTHEDALRIIDTCCEALEYAHSRGIVHGDLKPTNVLVSDDGSARLIDFGSSCIPTAATPLYASPQILAGQHAEQLDDVFSLACLSYSILSGGRHPFGGHPSFEDFRAKSAPTYVPAIPVELFEVIRRGLSAERERRPASVSEFRRDLTAAEQRRRVAACLSPPVTSGPIRESASRPLIVATAASRGLKRARSIVAALIALLVAFAAAGVLVSTSKSMQSKRTGPEPLPAVRLQRSPAPTIALAVAPPAVTPVPAPAAFLPAPRPPPSPLASPPASPLPHDGSSISFKAPLVHVSARQSLVAISVSRAPADRAAGAFVWRVEPGNAVPAIDYQRIAPRRAKFIEGQTVRTLFIPLLDGSDSHAPPGPRFFDVVLQPVAGGPALGRFGRITVIIDPTSTTWLAKSEPRNTALP